MHLQPSPWPAFPHIPICHPRPSWRVAPTRVCNRQIINVSCPTTVTLSLKLPYFSSWVFCLALSSSSNCVSRSCTVSSSFLRSVSAAVARFSCTKEVDFRQATFRKRRHRTHTHDTHLIGKHLLRGGECLFQFHPTLLQSESRDYKSDIYKKNASLF